MSWKNRAARRSITFQWSRHAPPNGVSPVWSEFFRLSLRRSTRLNACGSPLCSACNHSVCWLFFILVSTLVAPASKAQNYSLNIVGYATVTVAPDYNLLANPLNAGVTNGANEIMSILDGEMILTWTGTGYAQVGYDSGLGGWVGNDGVTPAKPPSLPPGEGFFLYNPAQTATNLTFVGEVSRAPGGTNCLSLPSSYSLIGSILPATVNQITNPPVSLPVIDGMHILKWSGSSYLQSGFDSGFGGWVGADLVTPSVPPPYSIGQGFFLFNPSGPFSWCQNLPYSTDAASPVLSVSRVPPTSVQISWPSNFTAGWKLMYATNLASADWQPVTQTPVSSGDALVVLFPFTNSSGFFRLQQAGGGGGCSFQATPPVINSGNSSSLTWCPQPGTTYSVSPGPGNVTGGSLVVSPTATTVYSLTASNASGVVTTLATVIVNPCGWTQMASWDVTLDFSYALAPSTASYSFNINHQAHLTFHLTRQAGSSATNASYFGFATGGSASLNDREDDKTGPMVFTTTEVGSGSPLQNVSTMSLHVTCDTYDFTYSALINTTETSFFGVTTSIDGVGAGTIATRPLPELDSTISDSAQVPAQYPPSAGDNFVPDDDVGKAMFNSGVVSGTTAGKATVSWSFTPVP